MRYKPWTMKELQFIKENYPTMDNEEIARKLNRTPSAVVGRAVILGVKKDRRVEYALYQGDELIGIGTAKELGELIGVKPETIRFYRSNSYKKRVAKRKGNKPYREVVRV